MPLMQVLKLSASIKLALQNLIDFCVFHFHKSLGDVCGIV